MGSSPYRLLERPSIYNIAQQVTAPGHKLLLRKHFEAIFRGSQGAILDVGCGPILNTPVPNGQIYGIDINPFYIKQYSSIPGQMGVVACADALPFKDNLFDESRCFGLLHHLSDDAAQQAVREMIRCTKPDGRVIILDNIWPRNPCQRPLAWLSRRLDRGSWVRHQEELAALLRGAYQGPWQVRRFTYTYIGQEAAAFEVRKINQGETAL